MSRVEPTGSGSQPMATNGVRCSCVAFACREGCMSSESVGCQHGGGVTKPKVRDGFVGCFSFQPPPDWRVRADAGCSVRRLSGILSPRPGILDSRPDLYGRVGSGQPTRQHGSTAYAGFSLTGIRGENHSPATTESPGETRVSRPPERRTASLTMRSMFSSPGGTGLLTIATTLL